MSFNTSHSRGARHAVARTTRAPRRLLREIDALHAIGHSLKTWEHQVERVRHAGGWSTATATIFDLCDTVRALRTELVSLAQEMGAALDNVEAEAMRGRSSEGLGSGGPVRMGVPLGHRSRRIRMLTRAVQDSIQPLRVDVAELLTSGLDECRRTLQRLAILEMEVRVLDYHLRNGSEPAAPGDEAIAPAEMQVLRVGMLPPLPRWSGAPQHDELGVNGQVESEARGPWEQYPGAGRVFGTPVEVGVLGESLLDSLFK